MDAADTQFIRKSTVERSGARDNRLGIYPGRIVFYGAMIVVVAAAVPNGTVEVWHKAMVVSAIAALGLVRTADGFVNGGFRIAEPRLLAPMVGVVILAAFQIVPSPFSGTAVSADPYQTRTFILVFGSLIVCGELLFRYADSVYRLKVLASAAIVTALASALFGSLWELLAAVDFNVFQLYIRPREGYAQFINRNHFAVMIEMALGLLIGLLLKAEMSEKYRFLGWVTAGLMIYSLIAASSRGGLVSLAGLAAFAVIVHVYTKRPERSGRLTRAAAFSRWRLPSRVRKFAAAAGMGLLAVGLVGFMIAFVGGDRLVTRFEKVDTELTALENTRTNRNLIWHSTLDLIAAKPIFGAGFGAYETAITEFDRSNGKGSLSQAHNEYLEILSNGGVIAFLLFAVFAVIVIARQRKNIGSNDRERGALAFGASIGVFGVMIHNLVDFGLHVMVNALLFVVLIVIGTAVVGETREVRTRRNFEPGKS